MIPVTAELQADTALNAAETLIGAIEATDFKTMSLWLGYTKGDETSMTLVLKPLRLKAGDEYPMTAWTNVATATPSRRTFIIDTTGNWYLTLDVGGIQFYNVYAYATGGTPTGSLAVGYTLTER